VRKGGGGRVPHWRKGGEKVDDDESITLSREGGKEKERNRRMFAPTQVNKQRTGKEEGAASSFADKEGLLQLSERGGEESLLTNPQRPEVGREEGGKTCFHRTKKEGRGERAIIVSP